MKNSEIHVSFDLHEVRDFLSQQLASSWEPISQETMPLSSSMDTYDWAIEAAKRSRTVADAQVKSLELKKAINILIEKMEWKEHDVSEETIKDCAWWLSFIGTDDEYVDLLNKIKEK